MEVWIAEDGVNLEHEIYGVFTSPDKAKDACRKVAEDYFGSNGTPPLNWNDSEGFSMAIYANPVRTYVFQVTRFVVDEGLLALGYVENQQAPDAFSDYLTERASSEVTDEDIEAVFGSGE